MLVVDGPRLPGVSFEREPPPPTPLLPRMDVATFVGFAERGPIDTPVPIEDVARFVEIFGGEVTLAIDGVRGEASHGHLRAAVHAFFRNGGRRCWVIRVAGPGVETDRFLIGGLLACAPGRTAQRAWDAIVTPARLMASSSGPWADDMIAAASATSRPIRVAAVSDPERVEDEGDGHTVVKMTLAPAKTDDVTVGDVLRAESSSGRVAFLAISAAVAQPGGELAITAERHVWFRSTAPRAGSSVRVAYIDGTGRARAARAEVFARGEPASREGSSSGVDLTIDIQPRGSQWPVAGSWVRVSLNRRRWWLVVEKAATVIGPGGAERIRVSGRSLRRSWPSAVALTNAFPELRVGVVRLTLWAGANGRLSDFRADLGLAPGHPRFVGDLLSDELLFGADPLQLKRRAAGAGPSVPANRFSLASPAGPGFYVPLFVPQVPLWPSRPTVSSRMPLERAGLGELSSNVFLDTALVSAASSDLMAEADFIRYESPTPRPLRGIHAALSIDEATVIAVPDAVQSPWRALAHSSSSRPATPVTSVSDDGTFELCDPGAPQAPVPSVVRNATDPRTFAIVWPAVENAERYEIEVVREPESWTPPQIAARNGTEFRVERAAPGGYRYRVRAIGEGGRSEWSEPIRVLVDTSPAYVVGQTSVDLAIAVQAALLKMCAARGDLFAVLSTPQRLSPPEVIDYGDALAAAVTGIPVDRVRRDLGADADSGAVLSYGALYFPWLHTADDVADQATRSQPVDRGVAATGERTDVEHIVPSHARPPDGAIAGVVAQRAALRGAWVAPAAVALKDVVALADPIGDDDLVRLHGAHINVVRSTPWGFRSLSSATLSRDPSLVPINVRRLLSLLRRLALLHGPDYVFEPNGPSFRRRIERGFEQVLAFMFERGAFAGSRAEDSFRVEVSDPPNTPQSVDAGRLFIDLKVAPSRPLEFLTVRLVRSGERLAVELA